MNLNYYFLMFLCTMSLIANQKDNVFYCSIAGTKPAVYGYPNQSVPNSKSNFATLRFDLNLDFPPEPEELIFNVKLYKKPEEKLPYTFLLLPYSLLEKLHKKNTMKITYKNIFYKLKSTAIEPIQLDFLTNKALNEGPFYSPSQKESLIALGILKNTSKQNNLIFTNEIQQKYKDGYYLN